MPRDFILGESDLPHSPKGFLLIIFEIANHLFRTSSFFISSETSLRCSKNEETKSGSETRSSSDKFLYNLRKDSWIFWAIEGSMCQLWRNSSFSFSFMKGSPTTNK